MSFALEANPSSTDIELEEARLIMKEQLGDLLTNHLLHNPEEFITFFNAYKKEIMNGDTPAIVSDIRDHWKCRNGCCARIILPMLVVAEILIGAYMGLTRDAC